MPLPGTTTSCSVLEPGRAVHAFALQRLDHGGATLADFFALLGRHAAQPQNARLEALGLNTDSELERSLGRSVVDPRPDA